MRQYWVDAQQPAINIDRATNVDVNPITDIGFSKGESLVSSSESVAESEGGLRKRLAIKRGLSRFGRGQLLNVLPILNSHVGAPLFFFFLNLIAPLSKRVAVPPLIKFLSTLDSYV
jgi:hypothetical protein